MKLTHAGDPVDDPRRIWIEPTAVVAVLDRLDESGDRGAVVFLTSGMRFEVAETAEEILTQIRF